LELLVVLVEGLVEDFVDDFDEVFVVEVGLDVVDDDFVVAVEVGLDVVDDDFVVVVVVGFFFSTSFSITFGVDLVTVFTLFVVLPVDGLDPCQLIFTGAQSMIAIAGPIIVTPPYPRPKISNIIPITTILGTRVEPK